MSFSLKFTDLCLAEHISIEVLLVLVSLALGGKCVHGALGARPYKEGSGDQDVELNKQSIAVSVIQARVKVTLSLMNLLRRNVESNTRMRIGAPMRKQVI